MTTHDICIGVIKAYPDINGSYSDENGILWKIVDGVAVGKRGVRTIDLRWVWLEDTTPENVKSWSCGIDADYTETFTKPIQP